MAKKQYVGTLSQDMQENVLKNVAIQDSEVKLEVEHTSHHDTISLFTCSQTDAPLEGGKFWSGFVTGKI